MKEVNMDYFLSENTIKDSYNQLTANSYNKASELFHLLLIKYAGISQHEYIDLDNDIVKKKINEAMRLLSYLYISEDYVKEKFNFINPFAMQKWLTNSPTEALYQVAGARVKNNITGGGGQWHNIISKDPNSNTTIKLTTNYLNFFDDLDNKFPIEAISVWILKFHALHKELALSEIIKNFNDLFRISDEEKIKLFKTLSPTSPTYSNMITDSHFVRSLIGNPEKDTKWLDNNKNLDNDILNQLDKVPMRFAKTLNNSGLKNSDHYLKVLKKVQQLILMGPPGTSKSYLANELSKHFDETTRVQFHPQYSYQDFIGGKNLQNGTLVDKKGKLIELLDRINDDVKNGVQKEYLLVIEEINRANISQVFGEMIQLLDRGEKLLLTFNEEETEYSLPKNLKIIGTMNTTDRTVGRIDYAIKRRFFQIYCGVDYGVLENKVRISSNAFSISDLLRKINLSLFETLNNKEMVVGHAIFLKEYVFDSVKDLFVWDTSDFEEIFNYVVLPIIEDYCNNNHDLIINILGKRLTKQLTGEDFLNAILEYVN